MDLPPTIVAGGDLTGDLTMSDATTITSPQGIQAFRAICCAQALEMWVKHKMLTTRQAKPAFLMQLAAEITGKAFKPRDYLGAAAAIRAKLEAERGQ